MKAPAPAGPPDELRMRGVVLPGECRRVRRGQMARHSRQVPVSSAHVSRSRICNRPGPNVQPPENVQPLHFVPL